MKVMTILGTRPEIIRLSQVIPRLDRFSDHVLVNTGQNFAERLNGLLFEELGLRAPNETLAIRASSPISQVGQILERTYELFLKHRPDRVLVLGDTNSGMSALPARRLGIPVYHMEAGNRCYDDRVQEEVNRRVIDHCSTVWMPYTNRSRDNLLREGMPGDRIFVTGNPIKEVIDRFEPKIAESRVLETLGVRAQQYFLVTMHRAENVDIESRLRNLVGALQRLHETYSYPVICSFHPRTRERAAAFGIEVTQAGLRFVEPFGFCDFIRLQREAFCVLSDSGTVQEESCLFGVPNLTIRDVTERPETIECGSNILAGADPGDILRSVKIATQDRTEWNAPVEYLQDGVAATVCRLVLGYRLPDLAEQAWRGRFSD